MDLSKSTLLLSFVGLISLLKFNLKLLNWLHVTFYSPSKYPHLPTSYGSWAVVTGATDLFGKAFAIDLARKGLNLVLVGSNPDGLTRSSALFKAKFSRIQVITIVLDFTVDVTIGMRQLAEVIGGLDVGLLVNFACVSYPNSLFFFEVEEWVPGDVVKANVEGTTMVTRASVAGMAKRGRGVVVNVVYGDSVVLPYALHPVYSATKASWSSPLLRSRTSPSLYVAVKEFVFIFIPRGSDVIKISGLWELSKPLCSLILGLMETFAPICWFNEDTEDLSVWDLFAGFKFLCVMDNCNLCVMLGCGVDPIQRLPQTELR